LLEGLPHAGHEHREALPRVEPEVGDGALTAAHRTVPHQRIGVLDPTAREHPRVREERHPAMSPHEKHLEADLLRAEHEDGGRGTQQPHAHCAATSTRWNSTRRLVACTSSLSPG